MNPAPQALTARFVIVDLDAWPRTNALLPIVIPTDAHATLRKPEYKVE